MSKYSQGTQYFVGHFDGVTFHSENPPATELWADHGPDFYAAQGWNDAPDQRKLWIAWMSNWIYARETPTSTWRGTMSLPRELALTTTAEGIRFVQQPVPELQSLRRQQWSRQDQIVAAGKQRLDDLQGATWEIMAEFQVDDATSATTFGVRFRVGTTEATVIGYDVRQQQLWVIGSASAPTVAGVEVLETDAIQLLAGETVLRTHFCARAQAAVAVVVVIPGGTAASIRGENGTPQMVAMHIGEDAILAHGHYLPLIILFDPNHS